MLHLPHWATDCLKRAEPELAAAAASGTADQIPPIVLWEKSRGAMRLAALDDKAIAAGLFIGQSLADARALVPALLVREIDHAMLAQRFADFADWHSSVSPIVSVLGERADYGDLCIDIAGVAHLFGGEEKLLATVLGRLRALGFTVAGAIAGSIGAAWALARFAPGSIIADDAAETALADFPVAALRLEDAQIARLGQMGLKRVGQLYGRDRKGLQARFGASLITRLDQALGQLEERLTPRLPQPERYAERRFPDPIGLIDDVLMTARDLAIQLGIALETEGLGAQTFHLFLYRVDHKVITLSVNAARATRDPAHIARLFQNRAERLEGDYDAGFGIDAIRLAATSVSTLDAAQLGAFEAMDGTADLDRLYDRMTSRLGPLAIVRSKFVNTHIPERAVKLEPVVAKTPDDPLATPDPTLPRPLRLLPSPEPIKVLATVPDGPPARMEWRRVGYRFVKATGPERIGVEWWRPGEGALTRDYYVAEDEGGRRFWVFREGLYTSETGAPRWFLHGFFA